MEIQGFKSFPDKTRLTFEEGLTTVVGPNGSGKSNIADAISWVMGEQSVKNLRGGKMEDVIFGGTQKRKPTGFSQVSITFDNRDHFFDMEAEDVTITRKYYRSGESDYAINKNAVRLKDIHELLMDTGLGRDGYSMISQGRIAEVVSAKSGERREIFEEAAGISKYRYRREQAERQLEKAQENILRLKDILGELEGRIEPLKEQSDKAERFIFLSEEKKEWEIAVQMEQLARAQETLKEHDNRIMVVRTGYDSIEEQLRLLEAEMESSYQEMSMCSIKMETLQQEKRALEEISADSKSKKAVFENDIFHRTENIHRLEKEKEGLLGGEETLEIEKAQYKEQLDELEQKRKSIENELAILIEKKTFLLEENSRQGDQARELMDQKASCQKEISQLELVEQSAASTKREIENRLEQLSLNDQDFEEEQNKLRLEAGKMSTFLADMEENKKAYQEDDSNAKNNYDHMIKQIEQIESALSAEILNQKEIAHRVKLLQEMEESMEDAPRSVKTVMKLQNTGRLQGILGTVAQQLKVPSKVALAVETALGGALQNLVVDKEANAKLAVQMLKNENAGRATFLPLDTMKGRKLDTHSFSSAEGFYGVLSDQVSFPEETRPVMEFLLGRIALCDTLDHASALARANRYQFRVVTLDGQIINTGGSLTGGSRVRQNGVLSRRTEIEKLIAEYKAKNEILEKKQKSLEILKAEQITLAEKKSIAANKLRLLEEDYVRTKYQKEAAEKSFLEQSRWLENAKKEKEMLQNRLKELEIRLEKSSKAKLEKQAHLFQIEEKLHLASLGDSDLHDARENLQAEINEKKIQKMENEKDYENLLRSFEGLKIRANEQSGRLENLEKGIAEEKENIVSIQQQILKTEKNVFENLRESEKLEQEYAELIKKRQQIEAAGTEKRQKEKELMGERENFSKEMARLEEQKRNGQASYDKIVAALWDEYELTVSEARAIAKEVDDLSAANQKLLLLRTEIRNLGTVNLSAIEEYREVSERYQFLLIQCEDVEKSREELLQLIRELTKTMENQFGLTFEEINLFFGQIFRELFGGGKASLELLNPESLLESGIDIHVEPPGKIVKNLAALSGGEQSLVAICIYFAILKVRPAPFCLLDEIEAALDDVNVSRFATYLRRMTENTQFIAISHRRGTMEAADILYGVTMQEEGVSKLLRLELGEVEEQLGLKAE